MRRATASAPGSTSVATRRTKGSSAASASATQPEPVPTSSASGSSSGSGPAMGIAASASSATSTSVSVSGRGMSTSGRHLEVDGAEGAPAEDVGDGLARLAPREQVLEALGLVRPQRAPRVAEELGPGHAERARQQQLGVEARRARPAGAQPRRGRPERVADVRARARHRRGLDADLAGRLAERDVEGGQRQTVGRRELEVGRVVDGQARLVSDLQELRRRRSSVGVASTSIGSWRRIPRKRNASALLTRLRRSATTRALPTSSGQIEGTRATSASSRSRTEAGIRDRPRRRRPTPW